MQGNSISFQIDDHQELSEITDQLSESAICVTGRGENRCNRFTLHYCRCGECSSNSGVLARIDQTLLVWKLDVDREGRDLHRGGEGESTGQHQGRPHTRLSFSNKSSVVSLEPR